MTTDSSFAAELIDKLHTLLPGLGTKLVKTHQDMADPRNASFAQNPDDPEEHSPRWHQYGIVTHSYQFAQAMRLDVPRLVAGWGLADAVNTALDAQVDGTDKRQLLQIASILHDTGKFAARHWEADPEGNVLARFTGHEVYSGAIVRTELRPVLLGMGMTGQQIEYVATCTELHFELGKARKASKEATGYDLAFAGSPACRTAALEIIHAHPDYALEIGLLFIADGLSKTEVFAEGETDAAIEAQRARLEAQLTERGLNPMLINQALQMATNLKVARVYLEAWASTVV